MTRRGGNEKEKALGVLGGWRGRIAVPILLSKNKLSD